MSNKRIYSAHELPAFTPWRPSALEDLGVSEAQAFESSEPAQVQEFFPGPAADGSLPETPSSLPAEAAAEAALGPSEEEIQAALQQAWQEGFNAGLAQRQSNSQALTELLQHIENQAQQLESALAPRVLDLAIDLARHMLHSELMLKPEHIIGLVRELTQSLPLPAGHPKLRLNPEDAALVREQLGDELEPLGWKILSDSGLRRGDCLIETGHTEIDARLSSRWQNLMASLGLNRPLDHDAA